MGVAAEAAWAAWGTHPTVKGRGQAVMSLNSMSRDFKVGPFRNCEALELAT